MLHFLAYVFTYVYFYIYMYIFLPIGALYEQDMLVNIMTIKGLYIELSLYWNISIWPFKICSKSTLAFSIYGHGTAPPAAAPCVCIQSMTDLSWTDAKPSLMQSELLVTWAACCRATTELVWWNRLKLSTVLMWSVQYMTPVCNAILWTFGLTRSHGCAVPDAQRWEHLK